MKFDEFVKRRFLTFYITINIDSAKFQPYRKKIESMTYENPACRLCGFNQYIALTEEEIIANGKKYSLIQCQKCSFISVHPLPDYESLREQYDSGYWERQHDEKPLHLQLLFSLRVRSILYELKKHVSPKGKILDWGAGDGAWVRLLRREGFDTWGIDPFSIPSKTDYLIQGTLHSAEFADSSFDAITCFHVLEHLDNPLNEIKEALRILQPGGIIIVEVPNISSLGFALFKTSWQPLHIPAHVNHFTPETLQKVFQKAGDADLLKLSHFSAKASPAAFALSCLPGLTPHKVRRKFKGKYPFHYKVAYLNLQMAAFPFILLSVLAGKGCIIRCYFRKR